MRIRASQCSSAGGVFYATIDGSGAFVIGWPTSSTSGTLTCIAGLANPSRPYPYPMRIAPRANPLVACLHNDAQGRPQLFDMDLATPTVETPLTTGPVEMSYSAPSFLSTICRRFPRLPILANSANDAAGRLQIREVDFSQGTPALLFRRISAPEPLFRMDPEYFVGARGVWVFYYAKCGVKRGFELYCAATGLGIN